MNRLDAAYSLTIGPHYLWHRLATGKYGPKTREKTGRVPNRVKTSATAVMGADDPHRETPCLWLHAVSVGEVIAAADLARMFAEDNPRWETRYSVTTATGRGVAERQWGADNVFYYPLDFSSMVGRAFDNIRPSLIVLMELEIWPNFLAEAARRRIPVVVANARITERSVKRLSWAPGVTRSMVRAVEAWFAQTEEYARRLERIGVPPARIEVTGSVKYDAVPPELDVELGAYYRRLFGCGVVPYCEGGDLLVVAGSTHPGEETILLEALKRVRSEGRPKPRLVVAPRHPERLDEVEAIASGYGKVARRSALAEPGPEEEKAAVDADVILVDTMGELSKIYAAADVVFTGGSLVRHGGQNFLEPCGLAKPTLVGPHLWNFREAAELLEGESCLRVVRHPEELAGAFGEMFARPDAAAGMGERARRILLERRGAARRMADRLGIIARMIAGSGGKRS
ncbi:MAG: 3-deoxy-D-manno-octulosonic acid transferase [Planctomycetota bacterium]|jgi:3-deoxy-D-manno-octulosonic-acid transferase|nr:3-deoxy-D-manno-octulosonic acid transferase [Planctomycetota bacterium]